MATDPVPDPDSSVTADDTSANQPEAPPIEDTYLIIPQEIRDAIYNVLETPALLNFILVSKVHHELLQPYLYSNATFKLNIGYPCRKKGTELCSDGRTLILDGEFVNDRAFVKGRLEPIPEFLSAQPQIQNINFRLSLASNSRCNFPYMAALRKGTLGPLFQFGGPNPPRKSCNITLDCGQIEDRAFHGKFLTHASPTINTMALGGLIGFQHVVIKIVRRSASRYSDSSPRAEGKLHTWGAMDEYENLEVMLKGELGPAVYGDKAKLFESYELDRRMAYIEFFPCRYRVGRDLVGSTEG